MKIHRRKTILFILSAIVILTSMYLEKNQIDADFRVVFHQFHENELLSVIDELPETDSCTETLLGSKKNSVIMNQIQEKNNRNIHQKKMSKGSNLIFSSIFSNSLSIVACITNNPIGNDEHVIQIYIHKTDGKKRA